MNAKSLAPFPGANNPSHGVYWEWKPSSFKIHFRLWNINIGLDGLSLGTDDVTIPDSPMELIEAHYVFLKWPSCVLEWVYEFSCSFGVNSLVYDSQKQLKLKLCSVISFSSAALHYWSVSNAWLRFEHLGKHNQARPSCLLYFQWFSIRISLYTLFNGLIAFELNRVELDGL